MGIPRPSWLDGLEFRFATEDDAPEVLALVESAYRGEESRGGWTTEADLLGGQRTDLEGVLEAVSDPAGGVLLALGPEGLVGCCRLSRFDDGRAHFGMFAVRPSLQGEGVGSALLAEAERVAAEEWGACEMQMSVISQRGELLEWYRRRGYAPTGEIEPFPYGDERYGLPKRPDLAFSVLKKTLGSSSEAVWRSQRPRVSQGGPEAGRRLIPQE